MNNKLKIYFFLSAILLVFSSLMAQTKIMGKVLDAETKEPLPFVNVYFKGTNIGATTDLDGRFSIETRQAKDSLMASFIGFVPESIGIKKGAYQEVTFSLKTDNFSLPEVLIIGDYDPAKALMKQLIKHKKENRIQDYEFLEYEIYNKLRIDANNLSEHFKNRKVLKPFQFIFDFADTSVVNGKSYLPIFLSESFSKMYYRKSPKAEKEVIEGVKISGVENESVSQFVGNMFQKYDVYDNYIRIFKKNFISPVSDYALSFYKYRIVDTTNINGRVSYKLIFNPRRKQELTFHGHIWIDAKTYALKSFGMDIAKSANINYVNALHLEQEYDFMNNKYWMLTKEQGIADFNVLKKTKKVLGFYGTKSTQYRNFSFKSSKKSGFYAVPTNVIVKKHAFGKEEDYWKTHRFDSLSKNESFVYNMVDTLKSMPAFRTWIDVVETIVSGYYDIGKFELGPYSTTFSFNPVEGPRFRLGGQTTAKLSKNYRVGGYLAYGLKDQRLKYKTSFTYVFSLNPKNAISFFYKDDIEQLGANPNAIKNDVLLASLTRRKEAENLNFTKEYNARFEYEWFNGFKTDVGFIRKAISPVGRRVFSFHTSEGGIISKSSIVTSELNLLVRFAYNEKFLLGKYKRLSLGTKHPVLQLRYAYGIPNFLGGEFEYHKIDLEIQHRFNIGLLGRTKYIVRVGKVFGQLPYPLLRLHPGNETFLYNRYAFNLMNYYEFVSDQYATVFLEHHFHGVLLDKIPLLRKLKWRLEGHAKGVIGSLSNHSQRCNVLPANTKVLNTPYVETGFAVENIFKIIKVSFDWRLTHKKPKKLSNFAIFGTLFFDF